MKSAINKIALLIVVALSTACAQEPKAPVGPRHGAESSKSIPGKIIEEHIELMSLSYEGKDPFGKTCTLNVSIREEVHDGEHHHEIIAKLGYKIHGESLLDTVVEAKLYNLNTNEYSEIDSATADAKPVLVSAVLKDKTTKVDFNKLLTYEQQGQLVQSLRIDFADMDFEKFEIALETVLEDDSTFAANKSQLDQLQRTVAKTSHNGHYDAAACSGFKLNSNITKVEYELDGDHSDHEEDEDGHGHGDEDEDDHGDEDDHDHDH